MKILGILLALFGGASLILPKITAVAASTAVAFNWMGNLGVDGRFVQWGFVGLGVLLLIVGMMKGSSSDM